MVVYQSRLWFVELAKFPLYLFRPMNFLFWKDRYVRHFLSEENDERAASFYIKKDCTECFVIFSVMHNLWYEVPDLNLNFNKNFFKKSKKS